MEYIAVNTTMFALDKIYFEKQFYIYIFQLLFQNILVHMFKEENLVRFIWENIITNIDY